MKKKKLTNHYKIINNTTNYLKVYIYKEIIN